MVKTVGAVFVAQVFQHEDTKVSKTHKEELESFPTHSAGDFDDADLVVVARASVPPKWCESETRATLLLES